MNKKLIGVILSSSIFIGIVACNTNDNDNAENQEAINVLEESNEDEMAGEQLDFESVLNKDNYPDVVAIVNGVELKKDVFVTSLQRQVKAMQAQGIDFKSEQFGEQLILLEQKIVDQFVNQEMFKQMAVEEGIEVTEAEMDEELAGVLTRYQLESEEQLIEVLEKQGTTLDIFRKDIEEAIVIGKYIDQQIGTDSITDEDIQAEYDQLVAEIEESGTDIEIPSFEETKEDIHVYLAKQHQEEQLDQLLVQLKENNDITINL